MKHLFAVAVSIFVVIGGGLLAGCGSSDSSSSTTTAATSASVPATTAGSTSPSGSTNYLDPENFADQVDQLKKKEGSDAELLQVTAGEGSFTVQLRKASNDTAYGYQSNVAANMEPVKVEVSGSGSLKQEAFPISKLESSASDTISKALTKQVPKAKLKSLTLQRNPASGNLMWTVSYDTDTRTSLAMFAPPSGSPLSKTPAN